MQGLQCLQQPAARRTIVAAAAPHGSSRSRPVAAPPAFSQARKRRCRNVKPLRAANDTEEDLESKVEEFMRRQAQAETGFAPRQGADPNTVLGAEEVDDDNAKRMCRDIVAAMRTLQVNRDMAVNEVKLTIMIEDPRAREQRAMDIETMVVSRDEMASALQDITEGRVPRDRIALRELHRELLSWPFLDDGAATAKGSSAMASITPTAPAMQQPGAPQQGNEGWRQGQARPPMGRDPNDKPGGLADMLPDWMGYGVLYFFSVIPVLITAGVVAVLFFNSLK